MLVWNKNVDLIFSTVKQKQAEVDDLFLKLNYTQKYIDVLRGDIKAKKNVSQEIRAQKRKAEQEKLQQVTSRLRVDTQRPHGPGSDVSASAVRTCAWSV